jgi:hypothetical protein
VDVSNLFLFGVELLAKAVNGGFEALELGVAVFDEAEVVAEVVGKHAELLSQLSVLLLFR